MRLLICTQAVDLDDPVLGFFHRWIAEFAKRCQRVDVVCLKEGRHELPGNVFVHSLGKELGRSRIKYVFNFYRYIFSLRHEYDAVFVHMNSEYVMLGGAFWRIWGKRIVLWYVHKKVSLRLRIGVFFSNVVCTASRVSFKLSSRKLRVLSHGIDTSFFSPSDSTPRTNTILFLGRLDPVKHVEEFVHSLQQLHQQGIQFSATIVGNPTDPKSRYAHDVRNLAAPLALDGTLTMCPAVTNDEARDLYRNSSVYCNLTSTGSFDKTILEAMASGCVVVTRNEAFAGIVPMELLPVSGTSDDIAVAIQHALRLSLQARHVLTEMQRNFVKREHSLVNLVARLYCELTS